MNAQKQAWTGQFNASRLSFSGSIICILLASLLMLFILSSCDVIRSPKSPANPTRNELQALPHPATVRTPKPEQAPANSAKQPTPGSHDLDGNVQILPTAASAGTNSPRKTNHYQIDLDIDYTNAAYQGIAHVDFTNTENIPFDRLYFRLLPNGGRSYGNGSLTVEKVLVNNDPAETTLSLQNSVLEVKLPQILQPGEKIQIELPFAGRVPSGEDQVSGYGIFNLTQGILALSGWYPILAVYDQDGWNLDLVSDMGDSVYSDSSDYSVQVTVPKELRIASTGIETTREELGDRLRLGYESKQARDFALIMSPDFMQLSQQVGDTRVNSFYLPGDETAAQLALAVAADSLKIFNEAFGPYPFAEFDLVETPLRYALGVEFPELVFIGRDLYQQPADPFFTATIAHEVAHQWWYNMVGNDVFHEPWLDEALATYASSLYYEFGPSQTLPTGLYEYWQGNYTQLLTEGQDDWIAQSLSYFEGLGNSRIYSHVVYSKGALFFKALREEIGDPAFFQALKEYFGDFQYQIARGEDLLSAFESSSGRQLDEFSNQWLYSTTPK